MGGDDGEHEAEALLHGRHGRVGDGNAPQLPADVALEVGGREGQHRAHGHGEDELDDGRLELEEDVVAQDEGEASRHREEDRVGGDEGIGLSLP